MRLFLGVPSFFEVELRHWQPRPCWHLPGVQRFSRSHDHIVCGGLHSWRCRSSPESTVHGWIFAKDSLSARFRRDRVPWADPLAKLEFCKFVEFSGWINMPSFKIDFNTAFFHPFLWQDLLWWSSSLSLHFCVGCRHQSGDERHFPCRASYAKAFAGWPSAR